MSKHKNQMPKLSQFRKAVMTGGQIGTVATGIMYGWSTNGYEYGIFAPTKAKAKHIAAILGHDVQWNKAHKVGVFRLLKCRAKHKTGGAS